MSPIVILLIYNTILILENKYERIKEKYNILVITQEREIDRLRGKGLMSLGLAGDVRIPDINLLIIQRYTLLEDNFLNITEIYPNFYIVQLKVKS